MRKSLVLFFISIWVVSCAEITDQDRVISILRNTAYYTKAADSEFKASLAIIDSLHGGRPGYQVADMLQQHYGKFDQCIIKISLLYENDAKEIENTKARDLIRQGIKAIHLMYDQKRTFVREVQDAANRGDENNFVAAVKKYNGNSGMEMDGMIMCAGCFTEAKKILGMSPTLDEFTQ